MDRVTRAKIESLQYELRRWDAKSPKLHLEELAARFKLDPMMVASIAQAEDVELETGFEDEAADPNQTTQVMSMDGIVRE